MTTKQNTKATESAEKFLEQTSELANQMASAAQGSMETAQEIYGAAQASANTGNLTQAAKQGLDTFFAVSEAAWTGMEAFRAQATSYVSDAYAENLVLAQKSLSVKTPQEFAELQLAQATNTINGVTAHSAKVNKIAADTAKKVLEELPH